MATDLGAWEPLTPAEVATLFAGFEAPWWLAGGYALELWSGHSWREHDDIDVGLFAVDQLSAQRHLSGRDLHAADPPGTLRPWLEGETLPATVHDIWARRGPGKPWALQLMLNPGSAGEGLIFRRDPRVRLALSDALTVVAGIPIIRPELQLLFKTHSLRPKADLDFAHVWPLLDDAARAWLRGSLALVHPGHPWLQDDTNRTE